MRRVLRWIFLVGPCRFYLAGESGGGAVPLPFLAGTAAGTIGLAGVGALIALVTGASPGDYFYYGTMTGLGIWIVWLLYALVLMVVLWVLGRAPHTVAGVRSGGPSYARHARPANEEPEGHSTGWRRRGRDPLVPGSLVAFFGLMAVIFFADGLTHGQGAFGGELATARAEVVRYDDGFEDRELVVRFPVGDTVITTKVRAKDRVEESRVPPLGGEQDIEYVVSDPHQARPAGATAAAVADAEGSRIFSYFCLALTLVTGLAYWVGRRRQR